MILSFALLLAASWGIFSYVAWKVYRQLSIAKAEHYHLATQVAELDAAYGEHGQQVVRLNHRLGEAARDLDFLQDHAPSIHYELTEIGGFRRYNELTARRSRYMYRQEQANLVAFNVTGGDRYLRMTSQAASWCPPKS